MKSSTPAPGIPVADFGLATGFFLRSAVRVGAVMLWIGLAGAGCVSAEMRTGEVSPVASAGEVEPAAVDWTRNPLDMIDARFAFAPADVGAAVVGQGVVVGNAGDMAGAAAWRLDASAWSSYPATGHWRSGRVTVDGGFTELLPSWNVSAPAGTGLVLQVRVWGAGEGEGEGASEGDASNTKPSPWLEIGKWGQPSGGDTASRFDGGKVAIDVLELERRAAAFELRVRFESRDLAGRASPAVRGVVAVASREDAERAEALRVPAAQASGEGERIDLDVPFMAQGDAMDAVASRICSPTATGMVMAYRGVALPLEAHAQGIYDADHGIFGNWGRAVAWASQHGLSGELARLRSWDEVRRVLEAGQPIIASIRFRDGEFPSSVFENGTSGHLIVIRGMTERGDAIVNDSASRDHGHGAIYQRDELAQAWLGKGGVAYLISPMDTQHAASP